MKSTAARAQAEAAQKAAELALDRYRAGALTQLDVTQSQRDLFQAQTARIQADADLSLARVVLRVVAGKPPTDRVRTAPRPPLPASPGPASGALAPTSPTPAAADPTTAPPARVAPAADTPADL